MYLSRGSGGQGARVSSCWWVLEAWTEVEVCSSRCLLLTSVGRARPCTRFWPWCSSQPSEQLGGLGPPSPFSRSGRRLRRLSGLPNVSLQLRGAERICSQPQVPWSARAPAGRSGGTGDWAWRRGPFHCFPMLATLGPSNRHGNADSKNGDASSSS